MHKLVLTLYLLVLILFYFIAFSELFSNSFSRWIVLAQNFDGMKACDHEVKSIYVDPNAGSILSLTTSKNF